jgi:ketosteroid isomerase-like protein
MSQETLDLARRAYEAFNRRDFDAVLATVDPGVEFSPRFLEMEGDAYYRGHDGIGEWWRTVLAVFPDFSVEVLEMCADLGDSGVVALCVRGHGLDSGVPFEERMWAAAKLRDGKLTYYRNCGSEAEALETLGLWEQDAHADSS